MSEIFTKVENLAKRGVIVEFKEFINRGNVIDLAVAFVMGAAFKTVVDSFAGSDKGPGILGGLHGDKVRDFHVMFLVKHGGCVANQLTQHCCFGVQLNKWKLNALVDTEFLTPRDSLVRILHCFVDAILRSAK